MARGIREFGIAPDNLELPFESPADRLAATSELPAPEIYNLQRQMDKENVQQAAIFRASRNIEEEDAAQALWERKNLEFGSIVRPKENSLKGYKYILRKGGGVNDVQFSPGEYPIFDNVLVNKCGLDHNQRSTNPAFNPLHPHYADYAPLRRNIAILRNYLLVMAFPDGIYKPYENSPDGKEDASNYLKIQKMADKLGDALAGGYGKKRFIDKWWISVKRLMGGQKDLSMPVTSAFMEEANIPDKGIVTMYEYLMELQNSNHPVSMFTHPVNFVRGKKAYDWNLLPSQQTPFSDENIRRYGLGNDMADIATAFGYVSSQLRSVDTLSTRDKQISVEHARTILEKLCIKLGSSADIGALDVSDPVRDESRMMLQTAIAFRDAMAAFARFDPNLLKNPIFSDVAAMIERAGYQTLVQARLTLDNMGESSAAAALDKRMAAQPASSKTPITPAEFVAKMQAGLDEVTRIQRTLPPGALQQQPAKAPESLSPAQQVVQKGQGTLAAPKITQVSDPALLDVAKRINEQKPPSQNKGNSDGPSLAGGKM